MALYGTTRKMCNKISQHANWLVTCDYVALSSNFSNTEKYSLGFYNDLTKDRFVHKFPPSIETSKSDLGKIISGIMQMPEVIKLTGSQTKIWSIGFDEIKNRFQIGKSTGRPPAGTAPHLYIMISNSLGDKLGFATNQLVIKFSDVLDENVIAPNSPDLLKNRRRIFLLCDFVKLSFLNSSLRPILSSFNNPYFYDVKLQRGKYGFKDCVEIPRSDFNHWVKAITLHSPVWQISLADENGDALTVIDSHTLHMRLRFRLAPFDD